MDVAVGTASHDGRDEDDEEDYEEVGGGNRLLGFMFGNVDWSGDLDVDYLDEDAKEHLSALADKLGPSLTDIDLIKSSPTHTDASEQDYDEKAEDAIDYEDIDEQYDGPEIQATTEEDHLLPKKEYFSSAALLTSFDHKASVFDEENYDEDEETVKENEALGDTLAIQSLPLAGEQSEIFSVEAISSGGNLPSAGSPEAEDMAFELEDVQEEPISPQEQADFEREASSLPILYIEDGTVILRFTEIFGVHEPLRKTERKDHQRYSISKEWVKTLDVADIVEESEEAFLRSSYHDLSASKRFTLTLDGSEDDAEHAVSGLEKIKDSCLCAQPMKDDHTTDLSSSQSPLSPRFYPLDQQDWEDAILWGNSPTASHGCSESSIFSEPDAETHTDSKLADGYGHRKIKLDEKDHELDSHVLEEPFGSRKLSGLTFNRSSEKRNVKPDEKELGFDSPILDEPFGSRKLPVSTYDKSLERSSHHPQLLRLESLPRKDELFSAEIENDTGRAAVCRGDILHRFRKLSLQNKELLEGSWLDDIIWDPEEAIRKPKLILDLQDEQMVFEVLDQNDHKHLSSHAGAMMMMHSSKPYVGDSFEHHGQGMSSVGRFNISNDKYYSNRKISQQVKSHAKKRAFPGIKVMHSVPALKLQTMKPKLSNKDIINFHRPKAIWFPHDNEIVAKAQGMLHSSGMMKIILATLGGKATKLHVNAEETLSAIKLKASKKLEIKPSEQVKVLYSGKELEDDKSLTVQNVRPNSVLHVVRTRVYLWPRAQKLPGENKPLRPPGAFKKKTDLSLKDGHVFLMESCEERPLLLGNVGMGARLCTYYQKTIPSDQTASSLRNGNDGLGTVITLEPSDKSPFLGDIGSGHKQSCLETNMYRAPVFPHNLSSTDYLLVRSAKGMLSLRRIDKLYVVGQQEPHMEVLSPGTKNVQTHLVNRMLVFVYREFHAKEKPGLLPLIRADELAAQFPNLTDAFIRKRLKHCADLKKGPKGQLVWVKRHDFRIPSEEELRRIVAPENVCCYESMQAGLYRLKRLGVSRLTHPVGLSSAINQLPYEAITLAAASHIERELQITSWNLTSNFVACTNQNRENIERLEITGVGDPSGRGLGFSYVRVTPKAPISSATVKKKAAAARVGSSVTGTDADLRRLSMDAAREVLLKFNVPEEQIEKLTRWHRIALVRKLSSEQAASGIKVDAMTLSKFARGQRMSFLQLQQQTREKCQEIWDRQVQSLSAAADVENDSDSEANSDLDSFAGDLENLLDAEEFEEEEVGNTGLKGDKADVVRGLKMRRGPSQVQTEEEIEDDKAEAALLLRLLEDDEAEIMMVKKKKPTGSQIGHSSQLGPDNVESSKKTTSVIRHLGSTPLLDDSFSPNDIVMWENKEAEKILAERNSSGKVKSKKGSEKSDDIAIGIVKKKIAVQKDGVKVYKDKKQVEKPEKPTREGFVCGACGQVGHMRTNKNCPKYRDDVEISERESVSVKPFLPDVASEQLKTPSKKISKVFKAAELDMAETAKNLQVRFKCGSDDKPSEKSLPNIQTTREISVSSEKETTKSMVKISIISNKLKSEHVVIRPPVDGDREKPLKKIIIKDPKGNGDVDEFKKTKKITDISSFEKRRQESQWFAEEGIMERAMHERRLRDEEKKIRKERIAEEKAAARIIHDQRLFETIRYEEARRTEERQKATKKKKNKKKKKPEFRDEYLYEDRYRNDRRTYERDRAAKRRPAVSSGRSDYAPPAKRRRGGEVELANILETIVDHLKDNFDISYLFLKPVTKKEAPDYHDIIKRPMDLSTIREKVRKMEYRSREDFRHDVWQITYNAHKYNDGRYPGIPPLADQLLELCDYHLQQYDYNLTEAESVIVASDV